MRRVRLPGMLALCALSLASCVGAPRLTMDECRARYASQIAAEKREREQPRTIVKSCDRRDRDCLNRDSPGIDDADSTAAVTRTEVYSRQLEECQLQAMKPP